MKILRIPFEPTDDTEVPDGDGGSPRLHHVGADPRDGDSVVDLATTNVR